MEEIQIMGGSSMGLHQMERLVRPLSIFGFRQSPLQQLGVFFWWTEKQNYRDDYFEFWRYAWDHFVDHQHGAWFRILSREGQKIDRLKSPPGKTDYHVLTVCWDILDHQLE